MAKLFDANGNEVEAFTPEELKTKQEEAIAEHLKNNPDKSTEVETLKQQLTDAQKKLEEAESGNGASEEQKNRLKKAKEEAEGKLADTVATLTKEIADMKDTFTSGTKNKVLKALSKGDADVQAKIDLKYSSLMKSGDYKNDEEGITKALTDAATIVTGNKPTPNFMDGMAAAGERGAPQNNKGDIPESENAKAMRIALDIKDVDAAKYAGKINVN